MKIPSPLNGWRAYLGEVGIIVLGVLIALGAQQAVENWSWNGQVRDFRAAADKELGENLTIGNYRLKQSRCVARRLGELEQLLRFRDGTMPTRIAPIGEIDNYTYYLSIWRNKDDTVTAHMPVDLRKRYAELYDELENLDNKRVEETETWRQIGQYNLAEPLDHADRMRLSELIARARRIDANINYNWRTAVDVMARRLGLRPRPLPFTIEPETEFCEPFLAPAARASAGA